MHSMHPIRPVLLSVIAPALLLATGGITDGGSSPLEIRVAKPVALSRGLVDYGQVVRVRPIAATRPGTPVTIRFRTGRRDLVLGHRKANRRGSWSFVLKASRTGVLYAVEGPRAIAADATDGVTAAGSRLRVRAVIRAPEVLSAGSGASTTLRFSVRPAAGAPWRVSIRRGKSWRILSSGRVHGTQLRVRVARATGSRLLRIDVGASAATDRARPKEVKLISMRPAIASWYDLVGEGLACGGVLKSDQLGVAHKTLPCGTRVTIRYRSRTVTVPVIDRGPFIAGREFDLTGATARRLGFDGVDTIMVST